MKIDQSVLAVLSASGCEGRMLRLPPHQLDRKLYLAVNKVVESCGGKWDRLSRSHVFPSDCESIIDTVLLTGEVRTSAEDGWFPTPQALALFIAREAEKKIPTNGLVLEPSAGEGSLIQALSSIRRDLRFVAIELDRGRYAKLADLASETNSIVVHHSSFEDWSQGAGSGSLFDAVFMNPPFANGQAVEHVRLAFDHLKVGGSLTAIMPASAKSRADSRHVRFRDFIGSNDGEMYDLPEAAFKSSGTNVRTVLLNLIRR